MPARQRYGNQRPNQPPPTTMAIVISRITTNALQTPESDGGLLITEHATATRYGKGRPGTHPTGTHPLERSITLRLTISRH